jgi:hypothetical protein
MFCLMTCLHKPGLYSILIMFLLDGGFDFSCPRDKQNLRMLSNQACEKHDVTAHLLIQYLQSWLSLLSLLHNTPKKSCKIEYKEYFTSLLIYMLKNIQVKNDEGMGHDMLWPKMPSWISNLARNPLWVSQAIIKLSLSRTVLWAEIIL